MERPLNFHHLHYFRIIAECASLSEAARTLKLGNSTLSAQLRSLEEDLGVELFLRDRNRLHLTPEGKIVLEHARSIFCEGQELRRRLGDQSVKTPPLTISLACSVPAEFFARIQRALSDESEVRVLRCPRRSDWDEPHDQKIDVIVSDHPMESVKGASESFPLSIYGPQPMSFSDAVSEIQHSSLFIPDLHPETTQQVRDWLKVTGIRPRILYLSDELCSHLASAQTPCFRIAFDQLPGSIQLGTLPVSASFSISTAPGSRSRRGQEFVRRFLGANGS